MAVSKNIALLMKSSSWIRAMFEEGETLKKKYGADNIYDFSLGNPVTEPPNALKEELVRIASSKAKGMHRYMTNSGYENVRDEIAAYHKEVTGLPITRDHIVMTVGAAGGLNVVFKSILDPGDEVIVPCPFFVEFMFYISNHNGVMKLVDTKDDFHLDIDKIKATVNRKTKAILINSPHNPTGAVYNEEELKELADFLRERNKKGQRIYIVADEAYRKILYNGTKLPNLMDIYEDTVVVTCHSKDLGLAGERIGYILMSPRIKNVRSLIDATIFANRILGFINAPAIMQRLVAKFQRDSVDIGEYQKRRDTIYSILVEAGFDVVKPMGAFYVFPKSPIPDDITFVKTMLQHHILTVPGIGFGKPGYFRIAYCVDLDVIEKSRPYFMEVGQMLKKGG